ncbi:MAG: valine--tRNA ligase [Deltaproteobacteria bacterium]|nr:MAG: valine--tRNA ligase [Deltaproteobacteria bacterium]
MTQEIDKVYDPKQVEEKWLKIWLDQNLFRANPEGEAAQNFSMVIPPPNVTGVLHMGHALNNTLQDILVRYQRMLGKNVLWVPGTDHAGIATQNVVERELKKEGKKRQDLGREKFIERVWQWKEQSGNQIVHQLKRLGASCDWSRERFTMDEGLSKAVREAFVRLYEKGLIYRDKYLINWCPRCLTALSDIEVEHQEQDGFLWHIRYDAVGAGPRACPDPGDHGGSPLREIVVATTRPETLLGDTAVAVHPDDARYKHLIGKKLILPLVNREIPVIADHRVDKEFGTGAVKVTPAHDFNDFIFGNDHELERINVLTPDAKMNENALHFQGMDRFEARKQIVAELEEKGFLVKIDKHKLSAGQCYRCKTVVEPYLSLQWFVKTKPLAERALKAVHDGKTKFYPENWTKVYEQWMEGIKDWCISRQIWWGHRIPAWFCECNEIIVSREPPTSCPQCSSKNLRQEEDVLDTWFSSGLWPFSTLGWPEQTPELKAFYPTSVLVTGFDIIFFWVARMMMFGLEFMDDVPFKDVYIHALVRDAHGQKMSKSKGNVVDPLMIMEKFGTDAFRFTLTALAAQGRDIKLSEETIEGYRNFCNKIWNASRFAMMQIENVGAGPRACPESDAQTNQGGHGGPPLRDLSILDKWILTIWDKTIVDVKNAIEAYHYDEVAKLLYHFFWRQFCDWYLEFSKVKLNKNVLFYILESSMRALHPVVPFITEEIWKKLNPNPQATIVTSSFPQPQGYVFEKESQDVETLIQVITAIRNIRGENQIPIKSQVSPIFYGASEELKNLLDQNSELLMRFTNAQTATWSTEKVTPKKMAHAALVGLDIYIPLEGLVDFEKEVARLEKEIQRLKEDTERREKRLADQNFVARADADVVEEERSRVKDNLTKIVRLENTLQNIR